MLQRVSLAAFLLTSVLFADANLTIKSIVFEGNEKIKTATLKKLTQSYIAQPLSDENAKKVAISVEEFYKKNNFALAYASPKELNTTTQTITITIKKHTDFSARALYEMKHRVLQKDKISRVFFEGNKKVTTMRLMKHIEKHLGKENTQENREALISSVNALYKKLGYTRAFATIKSDEAGIITLAIHKR